MVLISGNISSRTKGDNRHFITIIYFHLWHSNKEVTNKHIVIKPYFVKIYNTKCTCIIFVQSKNQEKNSIRKIDEGKIRYKSYCMYSVLITCWSNTCAKKLLKLYPLKNFVKWYTYFN